MMNAAGTLKTLFHLSLLPIRGETQEARLESFYRGQADGYDAFRKKFLHGRCEMLQSLPVKQGDVWYDIGAGTGESAQVLSGRLSGLSHVYLVDLCPALLGKARQRIATAGWSNVTALHADAENLNRQQQSADLITFSYSLTMIPNWFAALEQAWALLRPGGHIGVVDFYVARKHPTENMKRHSWFSRTFWPTWFASDNVFVSCDHVPYLKARFETVRFDECRGKIPFVPFIRAPYYIFLGRKNS
jgi:S-adenosylmethionine-diacylgycerolhomoserine-N-methlytransferase